MPAQDEFIARLEHLGSRHEVMHGGRRMVWRRFGDGPHLVLVHGGHGSWLHWVRNIDALSRHHTLWLPDMPSYGESDSLADDTGAAGDRMERLVDSISVGLRSLVGPDIRFDLAGFSFGGFIAARVAARGLARRLALLLPRDMAVAGARVPSWSTGASSSHRNNVRRFARTSPR
jgi:pimeloyl-ACP methyl ester carboxylesterase